MKTQEQKQLDAKNYLATTAKHLFVVNDKFITTLVPFERDGKLHYAKLMVGENHVSIDMVNTNQYKWVLKALLFPQYVKSKSIPYFKKMREIVEIVKAEISLTDNKALIEKIKDKVKELELAKQ
jgi:hypothetical protein